MTFEVNEGECSENSIGEIGSLFVKGDGGIAEDCGAGGAGGVEVEVMVWNALGIRDAIW